MTGGAVRQNFKVSVVFGDGEASPERLAQLVTTIRQEIRRVLALTKQQVDTPTQDSAAQSVLTVEIPKGSLPAQP
jgi:hypothetical protein